MIGVLQTTHPTEGYAVYVRYKKIDSRITILGIRDSAGGNVWGAMSSEVIQIIKSQIP